MSAQSQHRPDARRTRPVPLALAGGAVDARAVVDDRLPHPRSATRRATLGLPLVLLAGDLVALVVAGVLSDVSAAVAALYAAFLLLSRQLAHAYRPRITVSALDLLPRSLAGSAIALGLTLAVETARGDAMATVHRTLGLGLLFALLAGLALFVGSRGVRSGRLRRGPVGRTLIVGTGPVGRHLGEALRRSPALGLVPVGYIAQRPAVVDLEDVSETTWDGLPAPVVSWDLDDLGAAITRAHATTVILAFAAMPESRAIDAIIAAHQRGAAVFVVPHVMELHYDGPDVDTVDGVPVVRLRPDPTMRASWWVKRAVDVLVAAAGLLALAPLLAAVAVVVAVDSGRPVLFWQQRVGLDGRTFRLCKFRSMTMTAAESEATWSVSRDPRVRPVGRFLRASSLDELPQLWNILRGDMSLVGPRPERPAFVRRFSSEHERYWARHRVPVGLTGLAQVNGLRGDTSIADRARFDNYYIANWSLWLDVKIAVLTVREVLSGGGR